MECDPFLKRAILSRLYALVTVSVGSYIYIYLCYCYFHHHHHHHFLGGEPSCWPLVWFQNLRHLGIHASDGWERLGAPINTSPAIWRSRAALCLPLRALAF